MSKKFISFEVILHLQFFSAREEGGTEPSCVHAYFLQCKARLQIIL